MTLRSRVVERVREAPGWLREPLRGAWQAWQVLWRALLTPRVFSRAAVRAFEKRRVLGIYHFQEHAGFLGDMMEYLAILNVLRVQHRLEKIDLCYIDDPSNPNRPVSRARLESSPDFKRMLLELKALLPHVGAVLHFDSDAGFERFFRAHYRRYVCWPQYGYLHTWPSSANYGRISPRGMPFPNTYAPLDHYFEKFGALPKLTCPPEALNWARAFVRQHVAPALPVAAQIRFNRDSPRRNTDIEAWSGFFRRMSARADIKFVLLCLKDEIVPELRALSNVVYAKDHGSGILEDLALIQVSHLSLFPDAGFATYPWFTGLPTIFLGKQKHLFPQRRMRDEDGQGLRFLSPHQRRRFGEYDAGTLEAEFWSLWNDLAAANWRNPYLGG